MKDRSEEALNLMARRIRGDVAQQVYDLIMETPAVGSRELVAQRLRALAEAERRDPGMRRAAALDLSVGAAVWTVALDLQEARYKVVPVRASGRNGDGRTLGG